jgi:hypothetical protein
MPYWEAGKAVVPYSSGYFAQGGGCPVRERGNHPRPGYRMGDAGAAGGISDLGGPGL